MTCGVKWYVDKLRYLQEISNLSHREHRAHREFGGSTLWPLCTLWLMILSGVYE